MPSDISRRAFFELAGGVVVAGAGGTLLAACGGGGSSSRAASTTNPFTDQPLIVSSDLYASTRPQRLAFTMFSGNGTPDAGRPARIALGPGGGALGPFMPATPRGKGLDQFRGVYTVDATLPKAGKWAALVQYGGHQLSLPFDVAAKPVVVTVGEPAPRAASPTNAHPLGAKHVCTRQPPCPLHTKSLADLVGRGRSVGLLFATPQYCTTRYCGQVLDALLPLVPKYAAHVDFVHCEIYLDSPAGSVIPTVDAWKLPSEPWFFAIDGDGVVRARLDGAFDQTEMDEALRALS